MNVVTPQLVLSVGEFLEAINEILETQSVFVVGEVTGAHVHQTGFYFSLKDSSATSGQAAVMDCYMSPHAYRNLGITVQDGMEAKVGGLPSIYKPKGRFSFRVETLELAGEGSLKKAYELLKGQLENEGLFARKRPLPEFISRVGIITSRTGAVIDDFRKNLLALGLEVYLKDVRVEGARATDNITCAIKWFNQKMPSLDVLIVIRGGGSLEDMQAFNNEHVARTMFASGIPTIAGIGHDRDVPIASLVADVMTSTPTAAAIRVNASWDRLVRELPLRARELADQFDGVLDDQRARINLDPALVLLGNSLAAKARLCEAHGRYLESVDPERNLRLGYSIVSDTNGKVLKNLKGVSMGQDIQTRLYRGCIVSTVKTIKN